jgi:AcrR family transcriptional regulator
LRVVVRERTVAADRPVAENGHQRRARATRERILTAASRAFAREGYAATTIEAIAAEAKTAPASVYNHFDSKAGIAQALAEHALAAHDEYVAAAWTLEASPLERLIAIAGATLAFARERPTQFQAIALSFLRPLGLFPAGTAAAEAIAARRRRQLLRIVAELEAAVSAGELRPIDVPATARFLVGAWAGVLATWARPDSGADPAVTLAAGLRAMVAGTGTAVAVTRDGRLRSRYERAMRRSGLAGVEPASEL